MNVEHFIAGPSTLPTNDKARQSLETVVAAIVKAQGYDAIEASALAYIVNNVESWNRRNPSSRDFYAALSFSGERLRPDELVRYASERSAAPVAWEVESSMQADTPEWYDPLRHCLPSESEDDSAKEDEDARLASTSIGTRSKASTTLPRKKRRRKRFRPEMSEVPSHLPGLPPKHTWLSTPSYPAHSINMQPPLAFLDLKISSNRLMEASLRGLIRATNAAQLDSQNREQKVESSEDKISQGHTSELPQPSNVDTSSKPVGTNLQSSSVKSATPASQTDCKVKEEEDSTRLKKGRTLSLRLRTPSMSTSAVPTTAESNVEPQSALPTASKRPSSHRPSMSLIGSQSAIETSFAPHIRRNTLAAASPWTSTPTQSTFNWNASSMASHMFSPLNTPLTPGVSFQYPATPLNEDSTIQMANTDATVAALALPPTINYKRTWYKKSNSTPTLHERQQQRLIQP
ncbi:hypothetical protein MRB53_040655 [Persea americana]|nr:hypothetical protein MRB53_040655 [Persea americana]